MKLSVGTDYSEEGRQVSPRETLVSLLRLLWSKRSFLSSTVVVTAVIAAVISLLLPPRYESTTRLLPAPVPDVSGGLPRTILPQASALAGLTGLALPASEAPFVALLGSRVIADRIIDRFGLMKIYGAKYRHEARRALSEHTNIQEDRKTRVITVTVTDRIPKRAADIASAYVQELERLNAEMNTSGAHMERVFLEKRVDEVGKELHEAATRLGQFSTKHSMLDTQEQAKSTVNAVLQLEGQLVAARAELRGLEETYSPSSLKIRTAKAKIAELAAQLNSMEGTKEVDKIPADASLPSIRDLPNLGVAYAELYRRARLLETVQLVLTEELETAKTEEIKELPSFRVMEPAEVPEQRIFPRRTFIVMLSSIAGLVLALAWVVIGQYWDQVALDDPLKLLVRDATDEVRGWRLTSFTRRKGTLAAISKGSE